VSSRNFFSTLSREKLLTLALRLFTARIFGLTENDRRQSKNRIVVSRKDTGSD
jgi:hypothetical protein